MVRIFKKYGIKEDDEQQDRMTYFLKEIYLKSQEINLTPQKVFMYIYDIINFSKEISILNYKSNHETLNDIRIRG
jgi:hypothetical protein